MSRWNLRKKPRTSYYEPEEPPLDEYIYCDQCADIVYEYCAIHGPLLVVVDDKVPSKTGLPAYVPHAALTIPNKILHLAVSMIPGAGIGVFSTMTLPIGVRFGPYRGKKEPVANTDYCWQIYNDKHKASHVIDAQDANKSNWMRYVNCARHWCEQNLLAFQYQGQLYYRTIKIIPRFTELLVFYGTEFANYLNINMRLFNCVAGISKLTIAMPKKREIENKDDQSKPMNKESPSAPAMDVTEKRVIKTKRKKLFVTPKVIPKTSIKEPINNITKYCNKNLLVESSVEFIKTGNLEDVNNVVEDCNNNLPAPCILPPKDGDVQSANVMLPPPDNSKSTQDITIATKKIKIDITKETKKTVDLIDNEKKFSCSLCQFRTKTKEGLKRHINIVHTGEKPHKCNYCASAFTTQSRLRHHERIHIGEKPYKCRFCAYASAAIGNLRTHERIHTGEKPYKCRFCAYASAAIGSLRTHERIHTGEKPYKCNYCASAFTKQSDLRRHERIHTGEKPYKCSYCTSAFKTNNDLRMHERIHTGEKPYKCNYCASTFRQLTHLRTHERIHTGEKPYKCNYCASAFKTSDNLRIHERIHTGEKPYKCNYCASAFTKQSDLRRHERIHTGEKPYKCSYCTSAFKTNNDLRMHERIHTGEKPYKCNYCASTFTQLTNLRTHERIHTGEKPYKCNYCASAFTTQSGLRNHERIHTGEKPHKCRFSAHASADFTNLRRHERIHTGETSQM